MENRSTSKPSDRLGQLAQILKHLPRKGARWILADLEADLRFSREALAELTRRVFDPQDLLEDLSVEELKLVVGTMPSDRLAQALEEAEPDKVLESLLKRVAEGRVAYSGAALMISPPPDVGSGRRRRGRVGQAVRTAHLPED